MGVGRKKHRNHIAALEDIPTRISITEVGINEFVDAKMFKNVHNIKYSTQSSYCFSFYL